VPEPATTPALALGRAVPADVLQFGLELVDAPHQATSIDLELRLARSTRTDARRAGGHAARLLRQLLALAPQTRKSVPQQRQLDLGLALLAVCVLGEDVENHRRAVDGRAAEHFFEVELLCRRQLVVEHDGVGVDGQRDLAQLVDLAFADVGCGIRTVAPLHDARHLVGAGGVDQLRQLVERRLDVVDSLAVEGDADEYELLARFAGDEGVGERVVHGAGYSTVATCATGTVMVTVSPSSMPAGPPGWRTVTRGPDSPH